MTSTASSTRRALARACAVALYAVSALSFLLTGLVFVLGLLVGDLTGLGFLEGRGTLIGTVILAAPAFSWAVITGGIALTLELAIATSESAGTPMPFRPMVATQPWIPGQEAGGAASGYPAGLAPSAW